MGKEIKLSLVFRDMWQSAGKYQPRVDQLVKIAPVIIKVLDHGITSFAPILSYLSKAIND